MDLNDMPFLLLGALASAKDESVSSLDDMIAKGKGLAEGTKSKAKATVQDKKLDATVRELVKKGKEDSAELVDAVGKAVRDTLNSLGIVTKADIKNVEKRLDDLEKKISAEPAKKPTPKKAAGKKAAAKKPAAKKKAQSGKKAAAKKKA
jgi:polyhydroxyalkanoate synthesis regulator phasin